MSPHPVPFTFTRLESPTFDGRDDMNKGSISCESAGESSVLSNGVYF